MGGQTPTDSPDISARVQTGVVTLDRMIEGGFPKDSLIIIAGSPGTGKTVFAANFFCYGLEQGEPGLYVSFGETKKSFVSDVLRHLRKDGEACLQTGMGEFIEFVALKEGGAPRILQSIIESAEKVVAKRLVIDSFSAMAQAFGERMDPRNVLQTILNAGRERRCTTILTTEIPSDYQKIGSGAEEFLADGLITLSMDELDGRLLRKLKVVKLRGTRLPEREFIFTLEGGFNLFQPYTEKPIEKPQTFKPITDSPEKFSTGSDHLDRILGGGYPRGSVVLLEVGKGISTSHYHLLIAPTGINFLAQGRASIVIPSAGTDFKMLKKVITRGGFPESQLGPLFRVCVLRSSEAQEEACLLSFEGKNIWIDYQQLVEIEQELMNRTSQPVFTTAGYDYLASVYGAEEVNRIIKLAGSRAREKGNLMMLVLKPGYNEVCAMLSAMADVHLKITEEHGGLILYGVKPRTNLHVVEMDASKGYELPKITPIV
nr:gas vesicle protein GvpD [Candidatus Njordarchaeota archaeon]